MKSTFRVLFYLKKGSEKKNGEVMVMVRITIDGKISQLSTKKSIHPKNWDIKSGKAKGKGAAEINSSLSGIRASITNIYNRLQLREGHVTTDKVKNEYLGRSENFETLLDFFKKHNDEVKKQVGITKSAATYQKYEVARRHLSDFVQYNNKVKDIPIRELTPSFISGYEVFLLTECRCGRNTAAKFLHSLKKMVSTAYAEGIIPKDTFASYRIKTEHIDRGYLTEEEIKTILLKDLVSERLEHVRDLFIFSCFTGLAYIDVAGLRQENIRKSFDGNLWIMTRRQKTGTSVNVPLMEIPKMILEKYRGKLDEGKILPIISNQKLNSYLKEIADICGIPKKLTFHLARHTFATTTTLAKGIPIETVSKMLGHTNITTTQIYARITNQKISSDMKGLSAKFEGIEQICRENL